MRSHKCDAARPDRDDLRSVSPLWPDKPAYYKAVQKCRARLYSKKPTVQHLQATHRMGDPVVYKNGLLLLQKPSINSL